MLGRYYSVILRKKKKKKQEVKSYTSNEKIALRMFFQNIYRTLYIYIIHILLYMLFLSPLRGALSIP